MITFKTFYNFLPSEGKNIRETVFVKEQGFNEEFDEIDNISTHIICYFDNVPVGDARFYFDEKNKRYVLGRFAILKEYRLKGIGKKLLEETYKELKNINAKEIYLSAQKRAYDFYKKNGFEIIGDFYLEENYPHILMKKEIK